MSGERRDGSATRPIATTPGRRTMAAAQTDEKLSGAVPSKRPAPSDAILPAPTGLPSSSLQILALLAIVFTLYLGKEILLPITLALLFKLLLQRPMQLLTRRLRLPPAIAALIVILSVFGCIGLVALTISVPASGWIQKAPESLAVLQEKMAVMRR